MIVGIGMMALGSVLLYVLPHKLGYETLAAVVVTTGLMSLIFSGIWA